MSEQPLVNRPTIDDWDLARKQAELDRLEAAIQAREADLDAYDRQLATFHVRYMGRLAGPYAELSALELQIAARQAALKPGDGSKQRKAERLAAELEGRGPRSASRDGVPAAPPSDDLKALFRALTKKIHPDHAEDAEDGARRGAAMIRANAAYAAGDRATLAWLAARFGVDAPSEDAGVDAKLDRLAARIRQAAERLGSADAAYAAAEATDLARMMRRAALADAEGRDLLGKLAGEVEEHLADLRKKLRALERRVAKAEGRR